MAETATSAGRVPDAERSRDRFLTAAPLTLLLVAIWAALQLHGLGDIPFHSKGEPREAIAVQDVGNGQRYVLPLRNAYEVPRKPPLFYWLGAAAGRVTGAIDEATVRAPSAIQSGVAAMLVMLICVRAGCPLTGFFAALVLLTSFEWLRAAVSARIDMTLAFGTTASFAGLYLARRAGGAPALVLLYGGMIWGTLAKGPIGILLPALALLTVVVVESGARWGLPLLGLAVAALVAVQLGVPATAAAALALVPFALWFLWVEWDEVRPLHPFAGGATVALVTATWYGLAARAGGPAFVETVLAENFGRFLGTASIEVGHQHGFGYLVGAVAAGFLPWTLFAPLAAPSVVRRRPPDLRHLITHSLVWSAIVFGFFSLSDSKRGVYLLPMYPAGAVLLGRWLADVWEDSPGSPFLRWLQQALAGALFLVAGAIAIAFAFESVGISVWGAIVAPILSELVDPKLAVSLQRGFARQAGSIAAHAAVLCAMAATLLWAAQQGRPRTAVAALFAAVISLLVLVQHAVMPAVAMASDRRPFAEHLLAVAGARPIMTAPNFDAALVFHLGGTVPVVKPEAKPPSAGSIVVISRRDWNALAPAQRAHYEAVPAAAIPKQNNQGPLLVVQPIAPPLPADPN